MKPNRAPVKVGEDRSGQDTEATLQDEIGEPIKRSVDGSAMATVALQEQRTANGLNNPLNNPLHFQEDGLQHRS